MAQGSIQLASGENIATDTGTWNGKECHSQLAQIADIETGVKAGITADGTAGPAGLCVHRVDGTAIAGDGVDGTGINPPTGGSGIRGWLSGCFQKLSSIATSLGGTLNVGGTVGLSAGTNVIGHVVVDSVGPGSSVIGHVIVDSAPAAQGPGYNSSGGGQFVPCADAGAVINCSAGTPQTLVTGVSGKRILVCSYHFLANGPTGGSGTVQFVYGTGNTPLTGPMTVDAETGLSVGSGYGLVLPPIPANNDLKVICTGTSITAQGAITHTQAV